MHILVFFTFDVSLKTWCETGLVGRELLIYHKLIKNGNKVSFFTYGDASDLNYQYLTKGIGIIPAYKYMERSNNKFLRLLQSLIMPFYFKDFFTKVDIYKTNQMYGAWIPIIAKFLYRKKLIVRCGYEYLRNKLREAKNMMERIIKFIPRYILELMAYKFADKIILSNISDKNYIKKLFGIKDEKINVISNYVDTSLFKPYNIRNKKGSILFVGRLHKCKNLHSLLQASKMANCPLDIIGTGEQEQKLRHYARTNNISTNFLGVFPNSELPQILNRYNIFILPSFYEHNPKALLEAMACGLAVIGTNVEGIKEIITHNENGLLCNLDSASIGNAIKMLMKDTRLRQRLGANARKTILFNFSLEKIAEKECNIYRELLR